MTALLFGPPPTPRYERTPTKDEVAFFHENGFLAVDRLTSDEEILWLRKIFEHVFSDANSGKRGAPLDRSGNEATARLSQAFFPEMQFPEILDAQFRRNAKRFAAALLGVEERDISTWGHMIQKKPGGRAASWHQDHAYWEPELEYLALGVWVPLHDVTVEMGAMQFIPGSHKHGLLPHRHEDEPVHNVLTVAEDIDASKAVPCPLKMGGATFHHAETLHYTAPNATDRVRMAFPMEFQVAPRRRAAPEIMPWVDQRRAASGGAGRLGYVADGKYIPL